MDDLKEQIKSRLKIEDIIGRTVELKKHGSYLTGFCPFHDNTNTPAFVVWPASQTWCCFGACGEGGDLFSFVMKRDGLTFAEALDSLARQAHLDPRPARPLSTDRQPRQADWQSSLLALCDRFATNLFAPVGREARHWLHRRGLADETLARFRVGFNPASRRYGEHFVYGGITIPHYHRAERTLWGVKLRLSQEGRSTWLAHRDKADKSPPKYVSVKGTQQSLFNVDDLPAETVLICEGEFDVLLAWQEVHDLVTPISLGSAAARLSYRWMRYTLPARRFLLALDADRAGRQARRTWQAVVGERGVDVPLPDGQDLTDYHRAGRSLRELLVPLLRPPRFPLVIHWPAGARLAVGQQWRRLPDGRIEATYHSAEELRLCLDITAWLREWEAGPEAYRQGEMFGPEAENRQSPPV